MDWRPESINFFEAGALGRFDEARPIWFQYPAREFLRDCQRKHLEIGVAPVNSCPGQRFSTSAV